MYKLLAVTSMTGIVLSPFNFVAPTHAQNLTAQEAVPAHATLCSWTVDPKKKKDEVAHYAADGPATTLEVYFFNHEFGSLMVRIPQQVAVSYHGKNNFTELKKNKVQVTLIFDGQPAITQTWGAVTYPADSVLPALSPQDRSPKLFEKLVQSKRLTMSFADATGDPVTVQFDLNEFKADMDSHKEHIHHFGLMDGLSLLGGMTGG